MYNMNSSTNVILDAMNKKVPITANTSLINANILFTFAANIPI